MNAGAGDWRTRQGRAHGAAVAALGTTLALWVWPRLAVLVPACPIHEHFGVLCPGCGGTHALLALLHGHVAEAWHLNALLVSLLPFAIGLAIECYRRAVSAGDFVWPKIPAAIAYVLLAAGCAFTILRNVA